MHKPDELVRLLQRNQSHYHTVVPFNKDTDRLIPFELTAANKTLTDEIIQDTHRFSHYVDELRASSGALYAIGGYAEFRNMYSRSAAFDAERPGEEPRRLHLGIDIWGTAGTPVYCPLGGMVHSTAMNTGFGNYGATIILLHQLDGVSFYTLYGHLRQADLVYTEGQYVNHGQLLAGFGQPEENGHWPPHLHFQIIADMELKTGDYPGVCRLSEKDHYLGNCPDPDLILRLNRFIKEN
jgi:murein DD-endopeptidase MepM/ murein hydrolase activator NlpD